MYEMVATSGLFGLKFTEIRQARLRRASTNKTGAYVKKKKLICFELLLYLQFLFYFVVVSVYIFVFCYHDGPTSLVLRTQS